MLELHLYSYGATGLTSGTRNVLSCLQLHCVDVVLYHGRLLWLQILEPWTLNLGILHNHIPVFKDDYNNNIYWGHVRLSCFLLLIARNNFSTNYWNVNTMWRLYRAWRLFLTLSSMEDTCFPCEIFVYHITWHWPTKGVAIKKEKPQNEKIRWQNCNLPQMLEHFEIYIASDYNRWLIVAGYYFQFFDCLSKIVEINPNKNFN